MNKVTKGNFRKYFFYKLSKRKRSIIFFGLLNFLAVLLPSILINITFRSVLEIIEQEAFYGANVVDFSWIALLTIAAAVPISIVMITATTISSFRIYHNRADMDTLGCLPVSYRERFWGDLLSGIVSNFVSFVPLFLISLIMIEDMKKPMFSALDGYYFYDYLLTLRILKDLGITLLFVYLGVYAVTAFVCSCCGKKGSSVLYSFVMMAVLPGIYTVYGSHLFSYVLGMDTYYEIMKNVCMLPPFGPIVSLLMSNEYRGNLPVDPKYCMLGENPFFLVVYLLITAAFIAGAYFIGKRRRAENVGESFVFKSAYHALTLIFMVTLIGASKVGYSNMMDDSGIQWVMLLSFIVYAALEISHNKGFKGFWKTAVRFAAVFGVCFAFFAVVEKTNAFNMYKKIPSEGSIKEVRVSGKYFYTPWASNEGTREYILDTRDSVSGILSEHKSLLESDNIQTGDELKVVYVMKTGQEVMRLYSVRNAETDDVIKSFSDAAKQLPDFDFGDLGFIDEPDLSKYTVSVINRHTNEKFVRDDKLERLAEILRYDIENNYSNVGPGQNTEGHLRITEKNKKHDFSNDYLIFPSYTGTIEFLNDPDNVTTETESNDIDTYFFNYRNDNFAVRVYVSTEDTRAAAKELLSYIKPVSESDTYDNKKDVLIKSDLTGIRYTIDPANKEAVIKAMIALFLENQVQ